jgi:hypothetical protein
MSESKKVVPASQTIKNRLFLKIAGQTLVKISNFMSCGLFYLETHFLANVDALISKNLGLTH